MLIPLLQWGSDWFYGKKQLLCAKLCVQQIFFPLPYFNKEFLWSSLGYFCNEGTGVCLGAAFMIAEEKWHQLHPLLNDNLGIHVQRKPADSFPSLLLKSLTLMSVEDAPHLSGPVNIWVTVPRQQIPNHPDEPGKTKYDTFNALLAQWGLYSRTQLSYKTPLGVFLLLE